jgi:hypothetical protein
MSAQPGARTRRSAAHARLPGILVSADLGSWRDLAIDSKCFQHAAHETVVANRHDELDELSIVQMLSNASQHGVGGAGPVEEFVGKVDHGTRGVTERGATLARSKGSDLPAG